jgi:hypothetical protein
VNGFDLGPKLYKYCTPPRSAMDSAHAQIKHDHSSGENVLNKVQDCISSYSPSDVSKSDNSTSADNDFCNSCFLGFTFSVDVNGRGFVSFIGPIFCERFSVDFFK